jgi:glutamate/tyrosine decarboxylase-like PLP-dependent enzyme
MAMTSAFPELDERGIRALRGQPLFHLTQEAFFKKAARACGLGTAAAVEILLNQELKLDTSVLLARIQKDRAEGALPFMVLGTAGTTNAGMIDPIEDLADLCREQGLWLHVDAAWGGVAALLPEVRSELNGIQRADSITFDAHKGLSVPLSAGMFLTRHSNILSKSFHVSTTSMPPKVDQGEIDPYHSSLQWSRRFMGLRLFLSLAVAG